VTSLCPRGWDASDTPLGAGEGTSLSGLHVWSLWTWNLCLDFWDCPASLAAGNRVGCDHWNHRPEDLVIYKDNLVLEEQGASITVAKPRQRAILHLSLLYNTTRYSWIVDSLPDLWKLQFWKFQLPPSSLLFPFSSNPAVPILYTQVDSKMLCFHCIPCLEPRMAGWEGKNFTQHPWLEPLLITSSVYALTASFGTLKPTPRKCFQGKSAFHIRIHKLSNDWVSYISQIGHQLSTAARNYLSPRRYKDITESFH